MSDSFDPIKMENSVLKTKRQKIMSKKGKESHSVAFVILQLGGGGCRGEWPTLGRLPVRDLFPCWTGLQVLTFYR